MICKTCDKDKPLNEFPKRGSGYRKDCKECYHKVVKRANSKVRKLKREYVIRDKEDGCSICGEKRHYCLDYHHVDRSTKDKAVSKLLVEGSGLQKLIEEIEKCILLCANCHRELHWKENMDH
jgi:hypothetical protein